MKKSILLLLSVGIISICPTELKAQEPNVPPCHDSYGIIYPPVEIDPATDPNEALMTIENTSGCTKIQLQFFVTVTYFIEYELPQTETKNITLNLTEGQTSLTIGQIRSLLPLANLSYPITLRNISLNIGIDEVYQENGHIYPDHDFDSITIMSSGTAKPCDCLHFVFDWSNRKVLITRPVPPCDPL